LILPLQLTADGDNKDKLAKGIKFELSTLNIAVRVCEAIAAQQQNCQA
jgi:hypothetical protein